MDDLLIIKALLIQGQHGRIRQDVIQEVGTHSAGIAKIADLYRCQPRGEGRKPRILRIALQVNGDINPSTPRHGCYRAIGHTRTFMKMIHGGADTCAHRILGFRPVGKSVDFKSVPVMALQRACNQLHDGVIAKIGGEISDTQAITLCGGRWLGNGGKR